MDISAIFFFFVISFYNAVDRILFIAFAEMQFEFQNNNIIWYNTGKPYGANIKNPLDIRFTVIYRKYSNTQ